MLEYLRKTVAAWCSEAVRDLSREVESLRGQLNSSRKNRDEWQRECVECQNKLQIEVGLGDFKRSEIERLERDCDALRNDLERVISEREGLRAASGILERELNDVRLELSDERHEHSKTAKQLELASEENRLLAAIHEDDISRRKRELAVNDRAIAEAESAKNNMLANASEQE